MLTLLSATHRLVGSIRLGRWLSVSFLLFLLGFSCFSQALSVNYPSTSSTGNYQISWSGGGYLQLLDEYRNGAWVNVVGVMSTSGSYSATGKSVGTYTYRLTDYSPPSGAQPQPRLPATTIVITVGNPVPTVNASFSTSTINESGSAVLTWSSTNATSCSASGVSGVSATSGNVTYYAPTVMSSSQTVTIPVTCTGAGGSITANPTISVNWVNDVPTISAIGGVPSNGRVVVNEGSNTGLLNFTVNDEETNPGSLTVSATSSNLAIIPAANISLVNNGASRSISMQSIVQATGSSTITVAVSDGTSTTTTSFVVDVYDVPAKLVASPTNSSDGTINLNWQFGRQSVMVTEYRDGVAMSSADLAGEFSPTGSKTISRPYTGTYRYDLYDCYHDAAQMGTRICTSSPTSSQTVTVTMPVPTINAYLTPASINESTTAVFNWSSTNTTGCTATGIAGVSTTSGSVTYSAPTVMAANQTVTIPVTCTGGGGSVVAYPSVVVNWVNDAPAISAAAALTATEDTAFVIPYSASDEETPLGQLAISATSSDQSKVANSNIAIDTANNRLIITPVANANGSVAITVVVTDGNNASTSTTTTVSITPVNDAPTISPIANQTINEGLASSTGSLALTVSDAEGLAGLTITATSSNPTLIPTGNIVISSIDSAGRASVTLIAVAKKTGSSIITLSVSDGVASTSTPPFTLIVNDLSAQWINGTGVSTNGAITLNWQYGRETATITETTTSAFAPPADLAGEFPGYGTQAISRLHSGTYTYSLYDCYHDAAQMGARICSPTPTSTQAIVVTLPVPAVPVLSTSVTNSTNGAYTINWTAVSGADSYELYEDNALVTNDGNNPFVNTKTYTTAAPKVNGAHTYKVRACNPAGCGAYSAVSTVNVASIGTLGAITASISTVTGIPSLSWTAIAGATRYDIQPLLNGATSGSVVSVTTSSATPAAVSAVGSYSYQVTACAVVGTYVNCGTPVVSAAVIMTTPTVPDITLAASSSTGVYTVSWNASAIAASYTLSENSVVLPVITAPTVSYTPPNKANGSYIYQVKACNAVGCSSTSAAKTINVATVAALGTITPSISNTTGIPSLLWTDVAGATRYDIQQLFNGAASGSLVSVSTPNATLPAISTAGSYSYKVTACAVVNTYTNCGTPVTSVTVVMATPSVPAITLGASSTTGNFSLGWTNLVTASSYTVRENGVDISPVQAAGTTSYTPPTKANGTYSYQLKACNVIGCSSYSATKSIDVVKITAPTGVGATLDQMTGIPTVSWTRVNAATRYEIQPFLNATALGNVIATIDPIGAAPTVTVSGTYYYKVRACVVVGVTTNCSPWIPSNTVVPDIPGTPVITSPFSSLDGMYGVSWSNAVGALTYELFENNLSIQKSASHDKVFRAPAAKANGTYMYQVRACKAVCGSLSGMAFTTVTISTGSSQSSSSRSSSSAASISSVASSLATSSLSTTDLLNQTTALDPANDAMAESVYQGALVGQSSVGQDGSFNYVLPIAIAPGINKLQPNLQLSYNSSRRNGTVGWGWALGGLSTISRCPASFIRDGYVSGINNGDNYQYCLDGLRLVPIAAGEYRTENDSAKRIQKLADSWLVTAVNGIQTSYGLTTTSRQQDDQGQNYSWSMDQQADPAGNSWSVTYQKDASAGTFYPLRIDYTQNGNQAALHAVVFQYETRSDVLVNYIAGVKTKVDKRLSAIQLSTGGAVTSTYTLNYQVYGNTYYSKVFDSSTKTSRIAGISLCYSSATDCADPVAFDWNSQSAADLHYVANTAANMAPWDAWFAANTSTTYPIQPYKMMGSSLVKDTNNDGIPEAGVFTLPSGVNPWLGYAYFGTSTRDVNNDGFADFVITRPEVVGMQVYLNEPDGAGGRRISVTPSSAYSIPTSAVTFNATRETRPIDSHLSETPVRTFTGVFDYKVTLVDINGDGLVDVVRAPTGVTTSDPSNIDTTRGGCESAVLTCKWLSGGATDVSVAFNTGSGFSSFAKWADLGLDPYFLKMNVAFVDVNGDALADLFATEIFATDTNGSFTSRQTVMINNGRGTVGGTFTFLSTSNDTTSGVYPPDQYVGDFNGDGRTDYVRIGRLDRKYGIPPLQQVSIAVGTGKATATPDPNVLPAATAFTTIPLNIGVHCGSDATVDYSCKRIATDFNGDGRTDIVEVVNNGTGAILGATTTYLEVRVYLSIGADNGPGFTLADPVVVYTLTDFDRDVGDRSKLVQFDSLHLVDGNNDGLLELGYAFVNNTKPSLITRVIETRGESATTYKPIASDQAYKALPEQGVDVDVDGNAQYSYTVKPAAHRLVVSALTTPSGIGTTNSSNYRYTGLKTNTAGYGDLGFSSIERLERIEQTPGVPSYFKITSRYDQSADATYYAAGRLRQQLGRISDVNWVDGQVLSDTRTRFKVRVYSDDVDTYKSPHYFVYPYESSNQSWDTNGTLVSTSLTQNHSVTAPSCSVLLPLNTDGSYGQSALTTSAGGAGDVDYQADNVLLYSETVTCDSSGTSAAVQVSAAENLNITTEGNARGLVGKRNTYAWAGASISLANKAAYAVRSQGYTYNTLGQVETFTIDPDSPSPSATKITSTYAYNRYGSISSQIDSWDTVLNGGLAATNRTTTSSESYDAGGARTEVVTNALGHIQTTVYHPVFGLAINQADANGLTTQLDYDSSGRPAFLVDAAGLGTQVDYRRCTGCFTGNAQASWYRQSKTTGSSAVRIYYDALGREVGSRTTSLDGRFVNTAKTYTGGGKVYQQMAPYFEGDTAQIITTRYDGLGRASGVTYPDTSTESRTYSGLTHTSTNRGGQTQTRYLNAEGWVMQSVDTTGTPIAFTYTGWGDVSTTQVNNNAGTQVTVHYDNIGRKLDLTDPNTGTTSYTYNPLGKLGTSFDAKGQRTCYRYDVLERQLARVDSASTTCTGTTQTWSYDTKANGKGLTASLSGTNTDGTSYSESYTYTPYSLLFTTTRTFGGAAYTVTNSYDAFNRPLAITYPSGYSVATLYNSYGDASQLKDTTNTVLWSANSVDALGHITSDTLGNGTTTTRNYTPSTGRIENILATKGGVTIENQGYSFDSLGNLTSRTDSTITTNVVTQYLCYDSLNRLIASRFTACSSATHDNTYDALGNLTKKDSITGALAYGTQGSNVAGPHAITSANGWSYHYDAIGNLTQATKTGQSTKTVAYSPFNTPTSIAQGSAFSTLIYGPKEQRIKQVDSNGRTTIYGAPGLYEEVTTGGITQKIHYLGNVGLFIQQGPKGSSPTSSRHEYVHKDHLGSTIATSTDTLNTTADVSYESNGAWGERRYRQWNGPNDSSYVPTDTAQGFTGHEHLDAVGLIHMNGRVYDPELGRFMSADPMVQAPYNTQSYNRYSYTFNNPLSFTDPSGYNTTCKYGQQSCTDPDGVNEIVILGSRYQEMFNENQEWLMRNWDQYHGDAMYALQDGTDSSLLKAMAVEIVDQMVVQPEKEAVQNMNDGNYLGAMIAAATILPQGRSLKLLEKSKDSEKKIEKTLDKVCCFVAGTLVETSDGEKPIESIELGQLVASKNTDTGEKAYKPVTHLFKKLRPIFELKVQTLLGEEKLIETTEDHPFFVTGKGWINAQHLVVGDVIESNKKGNVIVVVARQTTRVATTYNLEVADFHTYYATEFGLLVHNCDLEKSPRGRGSVPPEDRDPKRLFDKKQQSEKLAAQDGKCLGCDKKLEEGEGAGHHLERHADGGLTISDNLTVLCEECHLWIHSK